MNCHAKAERHDWAVQILILVRELRLGYHGIKVLGMVEAPLQVLNSRDVCERCDSQPILIAILMRLSSRRTAGSASDACSPLAHALARILDECIASGEGRSNHEVLPPSGRQVGGPEAVEKHVESLSRPSERRLTSSFWGGP